MTATQVITEIDRLPPEEQQAVFRFVRRREEESIPESFLTAWAEAQRDELIDMEGSCPPGNPLTGAQWLAERRPLRPKMPGAVDSFIAERSRDRAR